MVNLKSILTTEYPEIHRENTESPFIVHGTDTDTGYMDRLEAKYGNDRISPTVSRIGVNSHASIRYCPPWLLARAP